MSISDCATLTHLTESLTAISGDLTIRYCDTLKHLPEDIEAAQKLDLGDHGFTSIKPSRAGSRPAKS